MTALVPPRLHLLSAIAVLVIVIWIALLVRENRLSLRDSLLWLVSTLVALAFALFPPLLVIVARSLQIAVPVNAAFALGLLYVVANLISLTLKASENSVATRRVIQEVGLLRAEIQSLRQRAERSDVVEGRS